jgi:hypothetical protein
MSKLLLIMHQMMIYPRKNHLHNNMLVIFVIGPNPDRIPTRVIDAQNRSVICTQDEGVTRSVGQVEALCRCLVDIRPVI